MVVGTARLTRPLTAFVAVAALLVGCTSETAPPDAVPPTTPAGEADEPGELHLMLLWNQHQPRYPLDDAGVVTRPWVRVHATKDYLDMLETLVAQDGMTATINLSGTLLRQLEELADGTRDVYWTHTEIPAGELTEDERAFVTSRFFDVNPRVVDRFPRFRELADARQAGEELTVDDLRDLQVLFNLAWTDPAYLAEEPLASLVEQGDGFTEDDKTTVLDVHDDLVSRVLDAHAEAWEAGRIELVTTPLAHPILPLIADTDLATVGDPAAVMPRERFREYPDAVAHVERGLAEAERLLGARPTGMWPGEGAVAQAVMPVFADAGVEWVATGESVLAASLGMGSFERDADDLVREAGTLYRPYLADGGDADVAMFFRDELLSDLIAFQYSGTPAADAVDDLLGRLEAIRGAVAADDGPHVVSIVLDGENAWEHYPNDGIDFLTELYARLASTEWLVPTTPSAFLAEHRDALPRLDEVFPGAWFSANYATWIGEDEEAEAWRYLATARGDLRRAEQQGLADDEALERAYETMLFAEGSDWFWWYGADQDSGDDRYFDGAFRRLLAQVYDELGLDRPRYVDVPIIPDDPVAADAARAEVLTVTVDGRFPVEEWGEATRWDVARTDTALDTLWAAMDAEQLYLRLDLRDAVDRADVYLGAPRGGARRGTTMDGELLGFGATQLVRWTDDGACLYTSLPNVERDELVASCTEVPAATDGRHVELAVPLSALGGLEGGDRLRLRADVDGLAPIDASAEVGVPDIGGFDVLLDVEDPTDDDHGPGGYTYPTDGVFTPGSYDLTRFQVGTSGDELVLAFEVAAAVANPWGSPNGLALQTFDVYIDTDPGQGTGARDLIDGRGASLPEGDGWEYAVTLEGWYPAVYLLAADGSVVETEPSMRITVLPEEGRVTARIPFAALRGEGAGVQADTGELDPSTWAYGVALLGQEGFPSPGVRRVRDVEPTAQQWRFGGAPAGDGHTRIIDALGDDQEALLGAGTLPVVAAD